MQLDPYAALELPWGASADAIKQAFRKLAHRYHPDRNRGDRECEERLKLITAAYHRLKESGWSLPRPAASAFSSKREPDSSESAYVWPQYWPDGAPIHYPTAEEIEALLRDVDGVERRHQARLHAMRVGYTLARASAYLILAFLVLGIGSWVYLMGVDLWWWACDALYGQCGR